VPCPRALLTRGNHFSEMREDRKFKALLTLQLCGCVVLGLCTAISSVRAVQLTAAQLESRTQGPQIEPFADGTHALKGGEAHSYQVTLKASQFFYALVEQQGIDLAVSIFRPDGTSLATVDSPNDRWGTEPVILIAERDGNYKIEIRCSNQKAPPATYQLKIVALREPTDVDRKHVTGQRLFEEAQKLRAQPNATGKRAAIEKYREALPLLQVANDTYRQVLVLQMTGLAFLQLSEFRTALVYLDQALALVKPINDPRIEGSIETLIGGADDVLGDVRVSQDHYERAIALARQLNNPLVEGSGLNNIGKLYNDAGDFQQALDYYFRALVLFKELPNQRAITLNNIGVAYNSIGENDDALEYFRQSLAILQSGTDKNAESYTLSNIGIAYRGLENYDEALKFYARAREIQQKTGNRAQEAETLDLTGTVFSRLRQPEKALEYHQQALQIQRVAQNVRREALSLNNLGHVYNLLNQPDKAIAHFDQSLSILRTIGDLNNAAYVLAGRARAKRLQNNLVDARKDIEESLSLVETVRARSGSQQLRAAYRASREDAYAFYIELLMQLEKAEPGKGHAAEALQASERGRARSLVELLNEAHVNIREGVNEELIARERELSRLLNAKAQRQIQLNAQKGNPQDIAIVNKEIVALEDEYQQVEVAIRKASPNYAELTQPAALDLKGIQTQLDANTVLLEYSLGDERSYLWSVTQASLNTYELPKRLEIQEVARKVYDSLTARSLERSIETPVQRRERIARADLEFEKAAMALSDMILKPVAAQLGTKRIIVVADGVLQYIPFSALPVLGSNLTQRTVASAYQPLVVDHEVITLPSASTLAIQRRNLANRKPAPKALAVIADPVFSASDPRFARATKIDIQPKPQNVSSTETRIIEHLSDGSSGQLTIRRLPFTRQEAEQILAVVPSSSNLKALDFRANRILATSNELSQYRFVHFATHGYVDSSRPDLSAIVLSLVDEQGKTQDGFLRSHEIFNLKLPAELVVLSACETGLGKDVKGEGLVGLTRGFMYAGARRLIVSLWNVNDKATATLMTRLYSDMLKSKKTPAASLRAAQVAMLRTKEWNSPYYWAAFVMQGEWR